MTTGSEASGSGAREASEKALLDWLAGLSDEDGVTHEVGARAGEYVVTLPGERKLKTTVSVIIGDRAMSVSAFVIRHPDENEAGFHKWLLERNLRLPGAAFAIDGDGDVYVVGRLPLDGVSVESIDELMGVIAATADESFNELLVLGFFSSMQKEWDWRISRGESTRNLEAFRHLLDRSPDRS